MTLLLQRFWLLLAAPVFAGVPAAEHPLGGDVETSAVPARANLYRFSSRESHPS